MTTSNFIILIALFISCLNHAHANQWANIVKRASEALCTSLREIKAIVFSQDTIMETLAEAIFEHGWELEASEF